MAASNALPSTTGMIVFIIGAFLFGPVLRLSSDCTTDRKARKSVRHSGSCAARSSRATSALHEIGRSCNELQSCILNDAMPAPPVVTRRRDECPASVPHQGTLMKNRKLGRSGLEVSPLAFGGNVFGWTVDEP